MILELRNPHAILAALKTRPHDVREIRVRFETAVGIWEDVLDEAERGGVPLVQERRGKSRGPRRMAKRDTERTTSSVAMVRERKLLSLDEVLPAEIDETSRDIWLALDCLQDPQNVGAILRSAAFFGVRGVLVTKDRSAPLNATVYDISAGGMEFLPVCIATNLARAIDQAKERGLWILGTSEHANQKLNDIERDRPRLVIVGNEQKGMRHLTSEKCDELCRLDPRGDVTSLNASVAAGVVLATLTGD